MESVPAVEEDRRVMEPKGTRAKDWDREADIGFVRLISRQSTPVRHTFVPRLQVFSARLNEEEEGAPPA